MKTPLYGNSKKSNEQKMCSLIQGKNKELVVGAGVKNFKNVVI